MTTEYEPGRIYSGVYLNGKRETFMWSGEITGFVGKRKTVSADRLADVRGPLVVLDADYYAECNWRDMATHLRSGGWGDIADQIEAQTKPPLQIGWHEVTSDSWGRYLLVRRWNEKWYTVLGAVDSTQDWTSTHYIGKASGDE